MSEPLEAALTYAARGWAVFPVRAPIFDREAPRCPCRLGPQCGEIGKHPRVLWRKGTGSSLVDQAATVDEHIIRAWWSRWPTDNVAIATGSISGLVVLDVDTRSGGWASVEQLDHQGIWQWATARVLTPTGGAHFYYRHGGGLPSSASKVAPGIDVRGEGGMVLAPPSRHRNGGIYRWQHELVPGGDRHVAALA